MTSVIPPGIQYVLTVHLGSHGVHTDIRNIRFLDIVSRSQITLAS